MSMGFPNTNPDSFLADAAWEIGNGDQEAYDRIQGSEYPILEFIAMVNEKRFWYYCEPGIEDREAINLA